MQSKRVKDALAEFCRPPRTQPYDAPVMPETIMHNDAKSGFVASLKARERAAWRELDIDVCAMNIPLAAPAPEIDNPAYTLAPGQEHALTRAMVAMIVPEERE